MTTEGGGKARRGRKMIKGWPSAAARWLNAEPRDVLAFTCDPGLAAMWQARADDSPGPAARRDLLAELTAWRRGITRWRTAAAVRRWSTVALCLALTCLISGWLAGLSRPALAAAAGTATLAGLAGLVRALRHGPSLDAVARLLDARFGFAEQVATALALVGGDPAVPGGLAVPGGSSGRTAGGLTARLAGRAATLAGRARCHAKVTLARAPGEWTAFCAAALAVSAALVLAPAVHPGGAATPGRQAGSHQPGDLARPHAEGGEVSPARAPSRPAPAGQLPSPPPRARSGGPPRAGRPTSTPAERSGRAARPGGQSRAGEPRAAASAGPPGSTARPGASAQPGTRRPPPPDNRRRSAGGTSGPTAGTAPPRTGTAPPRGGTTPPRAGTAPPTGPGGTPRHATGPGVPRAGHGQPVTADRGAAARPGGRARSAAGQGKGGPGRAAAGRAAGTAPGHGGRSGLPPRRVGNGAGLVIWLRLGGAGGTAGRHAGDQATGPGTPGRVTERARVSAPRWAGRAGAVSYVPGDPAVMLPAQRSLLLRYFRPPAGAPAGG